MSDQRWEKIVYDATLINITETEIKIKKKCWDGREEYFFF